MMTTRPAPQGTAGPPEDAWPAVPGEAGAPASPRWPRHRPRCSASLPLDFCRVVLRSLQGVYVQKIRCPSQPPGWVFSEIQSLKGSQESREAAIRCSSGVGCARRHQHVWFRSHRWFRWAALCPDAHSGGPLVPLWVQYTLSAQEGGPLFWTWRGHQFQF